jgi:hypothetical protein
MPKEDPAEQHAEHAGGQTLGAWEQNTYNADKSAIAKGGANPVPGATVPFTAAGHARGGQGAKLAEAIRAAVEHAVE